MHSSFRLNFALYVLSKNTSQIEITSLKENMLSNKKLYLSKYMMLSSIIENVIDDKIFKRKIAIETKGSDSRR